MSEQLYIELKKNLSLISGPCVIESAALCDEIAGELKKISQRLGFQLIFKASFDKANRTSINSFRGPGIDKGLQILSDIKQKYELPIVTDVHETYQIEPVAQVVDVIQIPAFLCRQTDLLLAAGNSDRIINIKKAQFLSAKDMINAVEKVKSTDNNKILLTERGNTFGYNNLVVDYRNILELQKSCPVVMDVTHSVQRIGSLGEKSGGDANYAPSMAYAAGILGTLSFFVETHPEPQKALSDGPNMIPLNQIENLMSNLKKVTQAYSELVSLEL